MKKGITSAVLFLFLINIGGYYYWYRIAREFNYSKVRHEIESQLIREGLQEISVPLYQIHLLKWTRKDREFEYRGEMYDVVDSRVNGGTMVFRCLRDTKEKALVARFNRRARTQKERSNFFKKIPSPSFIYSDPREIKNSGIARCLRVYYHSLYHSRKIETHSPPPNYTAA